MSNHLKIAPIGLDYYIQQLQIYAYDSLFNSWGSSGLTSAQFEYYGRAYRNWKNDASGGGYVPEVFKQGKEYSEVLFNDKVAALMWFGVNDPEGVEENQKHTNKVSLYGFVNLNLIKPDDNGQRVDMEVVNEVVNLIDRKYGFRVVNIYRNIDKVLEYYTGQKIKDGVKTFNMQPNMSFRIDMENTINIALPVSCGNGLTLPVYYNAMTCTITVVFKDVPDSSVLQTLCNGRQIALQYPTGSTVTIPHLIGRYVQKIQVLNYENVKLPYDIAAGMFTYSGAGQFSDGDILEIEYNEN